MAIWPFRHKGSTPPRPPIQNGALEALAHLFVRDPANPVPGSDELPADRFDFSVASLAAMDAHLERVRTLTMSDRDRSRFLLRSGAYVGEVIRRHAFRPKTWDWLSYKDAAAFHPFVASLGMSAETAAVLWDGNDGVVFPAMKVAKYLANGSEDSVLFYAKVLIAGPPTLTQ